jgi:hypothetical protein
MRFRDRRHFVNRPAGRAAKMTRTPRPATARSSPSRRASHRATRHDRHSIACGNSGARTRTTRIAGGLARILRHPPGPGPGRNRSHASVPRASAWVRNRSLRAAAGTGRRSDRGGVNGSLPAKRYRDPWLSHRAEYQERSQAAWTPVCRPETRQIKELERFGESRKRRTAPDDPCRRLDDLSRFVRMTIAFALVCKNNARLPVASTVAARAIRCGNWRLSQTE